MLSVKEAKKLIEELKNKEISLGRDPSTWYTYENHVYGVANLAKGLAEELKMKNVDTIYISALLHDICRTEEERAGRFHGILGYEKLENIDKNAARSSLLHTFLWCRIEPYQECAQRFYNCKKDYDFVVDFINHTTPTDEDYLIQLCDNLANKDGWVTLEERMEEYAKRHKLSDVSEILAQSNELKSYFDKKLGFDIYKFMKIKE